MTDQEKIAILIEAVKEYEDYSGIVELEFNPGRVYWHCHCCDEEWMPRHRDGHDPECAINNALKIAYP